MTLSYAHSLSLLDVHLAKVTCLAALYDLAWPPFHSEEIRSMFDTRCTVYWQAIKEEYEVVVCDTSGRLHTNASLMEELAKCKRAIGKRLANAPHETLLVLDGTTGNLHHCLLCRALLCRVQ